MNNKLSTCTSITYTCTMTAVMYDYSFAKYVYTLLHPVILLPTFINTNFSSV